MNPIGQLASKVPQTPSVKTVFCTSAISLVAAGTYFLIKMAAGEMPVEAPRFLAIVATFGAGGLLVYVGHCHSPR